MRRGWEDHEERDDQEIMEERSRRPPKAISKRATSVMADAERSGETITREEALDRACDLLEQGQPTEQLAVWFYRRPKQQEFYSDFIRAFWNTKERLYPPGGEYQPPMPNLSPPFISHLLSGAPEETGWARDPLFLRVFLTTCAPDAPDEVAAAIRAWLGISFEGNDVAEAAERARTTALYLMGGQFREALGAFQEVLLLAPSLRNDPERVWQLATNLVTAGRHLGDRLTKIAQDPQLTAEQKRVMSLRLLGRALLDGLIVE